MKRYNVPRLAFTNKLDRAGANPFLVIQASRDDYAEIYAGLRDLVGITLGLST